MHCCKNAAKPRITPPRLLMLMTGLFLALLAMAIRPAAAQFDILSADSYLLDGVYHANVKISYVFNAEALEALDNGLALTIALEIEVLRQRAAWLDESIAVLIIRYRIEKHALTGHYIVRNLNSWASTTYKNYKTLLANFGDIKRLPLIDALLLKAGEYYYLRARTYLELSDLPVPMRLRAYLTSSWDIESQRFQWPLLSPYSP